MERTLKTDRLILRLIEQSDAVIINTLTNDKDITSMTAQIPYPCSLNDTKSWIDDQAKACNEGYQANFAILAKDSNKLVGVIGLEINKQHKRAELGYWVGKKYWGKGYASESGKKVLEYAFKELKLHRVSAHLMQGNTPSKKVLQKLGMQYEGRLRGYIRKDEVFHDVESYSVLFDDYVKTLA